MKFRRITSIMMLLVFCFSCEDTTIQSKVVGRVETTVPVLEAISISDSTRFLNDLKLSPYWKVERVRDDDGLVGLVAKARSIEAKPDIGGRNSQFLFEFIQENPGELGDRQIYNDSLRGDDASFSAFSAMVVFEDPEKGVTRIKSGTKVSVPVESFQTTFGPDSSSKVAVSLSDEDAIFLLVSEKGADPKRSTTWKKLPKIMQELKRLTRLPEEYLVVEQYSTLFSILFPDNQPDYRIQRMSGIEGRDTFYGFIRPKDQWNLEGVNIKISHPEYCGGECTRESARKRKAELLGAASNSNRDRLFFLIEDNAVYLKPPYHGEFGTFSGYKSFEGTLDIIDGFGKTIATTKEQFKGWEQVPTLRRSGHSR